MGEKKATQIELVFRLGKTSNVIHNLPLIYTTESLSQPYLTNKTKLYHNMGLFSRHAEPVEEPAPQRQPVYEEPPRRHGLFGSKHHSPTRAPTNATHSTRSSTTTSSPDRSTGGGGIFRRSTDASHNPSMNSHQRTSGSGGGLLHKTFGGNREEMDPSIVQARERVMGAEAAEMEADRALIAARESVREAREHVRMLEVEAKEEARRAKIKEHHAKEFSKRGKLLGRKLTVVRVSVVV